MKKALAVVLALGLVLGASATDEDAEAAVIAMDVNDLTDGSTLVMRANVIDHSVAWTPDGAMINSTLELQPLEVLKGSAPNNVLVEVPGGDLGGIRIRNAEAPEFALGEQVIVFVKADEDGKNRVYGWFQGKYTVLEGNAIRELNGVDYETFRGQILAALSN
jgi:hypothetical protein